MLHRITLRLSQLALELTCWLLIPTLFILYYTQVTHTGTSVIKSHLLAISPLIICALSLRYATYKTLPSKLYYFINLTTYTAIIFLGTLYYALVLIGLKLWNNVITKKFIITYSDQLNYLLKATETPIIVVLAITLISVYTCYKFSSLVLLTKWPEQPVLRPIFTSVKVTLALIGSLITSYHFYIYLQFGGDDLNEPIHRTVSESIPKSYGYAMQGLHHDPNIIALDIETNNNYSPNQNITPLNIITIVVDGLRADRTPGHKYTRNLMPYLSKLESQKKLKIFSQTRTACAETTCAHAALFASKFTHQLHNKLLKLQDILKLHNYHTKFIISGDHINFYNIRDIYGDVDEYFDGSMQKKYYINDDRVIIDKTNALPDWNNIPTMIHYHLLSTHNLGERYSQFNVYLPQKPFNGSEHAETKIEYVNHYDNRVLQTDWVIKSILNSLEKKHYLDKALVIITADHGDSIGEHSVYAHTNSVYEEPLRIPLIFIPYGYKSKIPDQYNQLFSIIDIAPTILHELSIPIPASWEGFPIQSTMHREYTYFIMRPNIGFYHDTPGEDLWKFWFNEITHEEFAYNITKDPKETKNLIKSAPKNLKEKWHNHHISFYKRTLE